MESMTTISELEPDDFVKINGRNEKDEPEDWFGQVNKVVPPNVMVCLLTTQQDGSLVFDGTEHTFELATVNDFVSLARHATHEAAWKKLGIRMLNSTSSPFTFVEIAKEDQLGLHDVGEEESDDSDDESVGSLKDFIVEEDVPWSPADPNAPEVRPGASKVVQEIHDAVHEYNEWVPANETERGVRRFIDRVEKRAVHADSDLHFLKGEADPDYSRRSKKRKTTNA
jgi:hypothetical protein